MPDFGMSVPDINLPLILYRGIRELSLPIEIFSATQHLSTTLDLTPSFSPPPQKSTRLNTYLRNPEIPHMASLLISTKLLFPSNLPCINSFFCSGVPNSLTINTSGKFPTMLCSFCKSLNRPNPFLAKCIRITAIQRLPPFLPPYSSGRQNL